MNIQIAVNRHFTNKLPPGDARWAKFNDTFETLTLDAKGVAQQVQAGHAFTAVHKEHRHSRNFISAQHLALDCDHIGFGPLLSDPFIAQYASFLYTTASHKPEDPRTRVVFILDQPITDAGAYALAAGALTWKFAGEADSSCKDAARLFFGSKGCQIHHIGHILPLAMVQQMADEFNAAMEAARTRHRPNRNTSTTPDITKIADALFVIPKQMDYYEWLHIGMGVHSQYPGPEGVALVEAWSPGYPGEWERKFASFSTTGNRAGRVGIGTVFHMAKENGWQQRNGHTSAEPEPPPVDDPTPEPLVPIIPPPALGWLDDCAGVLTWLSGAPLDFNRLCALVTTATAIQHRAVLRMSFGDIRPNIYGCIVAMSTVFHKSAALRQIRRLLRRAELDELVLSELMTSEGLLRQLQGQAAGVIIRDEIGTLFGSDKIKYLAQLKQDLTALFDGDPYSRQLSHEKVTVANPYLNICGATTPSRFYESVSFGDWHGGFMPRWLFVLAPEGEPSISVGGGQLTPQDDDGITEMASKLSWIGRQPATNFAIASDAFKHWEGWYQQVVREAYNLGDDVQAAVTGRYTTYALKFCILLAAVNGTWGQITDAEMTTAIALSDYYKAVIERLLNERQDYGVSGAKLQKVFAVIGGSPNISTKQILQYANMKSSEARPVLEKLVEIGAVTCEKAGHGFRYATTADRLPIKAW